VKLKRVFRFFQRKALARLRGARVDDFGHDTVIRLPESNLRGLKLKITGSGHRIEIEEGCSVEGTTIHVSGNNNCLRIGKGSILSPGTHIWLLFSNNTIEIGQNTQFIGGCIWTGDDNCRVAIGSHCLIAPGVDIRCGDGHPIYDLQSGERLNVATHLIVEDRVWLARQVSVLKNVVIGEGSIVGTLSLVTRDVPKNVIAAGVPARMIRENIRWEV
jgi:acetyltransferase-like isoleucine patch superfamily enzyme